MSTIIRSSSYEIFIGNDTFIQLEKFLLKHYSGRKIFILVDENTNEKCLPFISERISMLKDAVVLQMESGEKNKSLSTCEELWKQLTDHHADRKSLLINLGGGVVGDVGGFVAATYMRGIDFINIPTTLLAMVDASAGGKNGINFSGLKNQVGTFTKPAAVFISPFFLKTLAEREIKSGFAEVIKHALIADAEKWEELRQLNSLADVNWIKIIDHSVYIKNKIVNADFRERNKRKSLNFGHTIGHALESYSVKHHADPLKHGEAVAIGMIGEIYLSMKHLDFPSNTAEEVISFIQKHFVNMVAEINPDEVLELIHSDKKKEQSEVNFVLLKNIADPFINQNPSDELVKQAIGFSLQPFKSSVDLHQ
ncbi:MAG: 3-dehydroquinate synthase [Bacteroidetes bacterium]|nr:3-dehydroquinate synthase [Bacteroidota bacterium]